MRAAVLALGISVPLLAGCPAVSSEPPPPLRKPEIPTAPPHALGALAAGTDAAPKPDVTLPGGEAEPDAPPVTPPVAPGPAPEGSGDAPEPPAPAAPHATPDAGMAL